jgi:hypothetical protein
MALSPSGTKLAINYNPDVSPHTKITDMLKVMNLATGAIRTWTSAAGEILTAGNALDLSWANDNMTLGFNWWGITLSPERNLPTSGFWLLDTAKSGGNLIADSRRVLRYKEGAPFIIVKGGYFAAAQPVLAPDGRTIIAALTSGQSDTAGYFWFATYDAANGQLERRFDRTSLSKTPLGPTFGVFWTSPFAKLLVVAGPPGHHGQIDILRQSGHATVLPHGQQQVLVPGPAW